MQIDKNEDNCEKILNNQKKTRYNRDLLVLFKTSLQANKTKQPHTNTTLALNDCMQRMDLSHKIQNTVQAWHTKNISEISAHIIFSTRIKCLNIIGLLRSALQK
jgi:hypothetical protein